MADNTNSSMGVIVGIVAIVAILALLYFIVQQLQVRSQTQDDGPSINLELNSGSENGDKNKEGLY